MKSYEELDIRRAIIFAFGDKPGRLKKVLKVFEKMIPEIMEFFMDRKQPGPNQINDIL
jgi:hypothetical protein